MWLLERQLLSILSNLGFLFVFSVFLLRPNLFHIWLGFLVIVGLLWNFTTGLGLSIRNSNHHNSCITWISLASYNTCIYDYGILILILTFWWISYTSYIIWPQIYIYYELSLCNLGFRILWPSSFLLFRAYIIYWFSRGHLSLFGHPGALSCWGLDYFLVGFMCRSIICIYSKL